MTPLETALAKIQTAFPPPLAALSPQTVKFAHDSDLQCDQNARSVRKDALMNYDQFEMIFDPIFQSCPTWIHFHVIGLPPQFFPYSYLVTYIASKQHGHGGPAINLSHDLQRTLTVEDK